MVITTYNRAHLVGRAIDSALSQTYSAIDVVVVDDGSSDDTMDVLARYADEPRLRVVRHERNRGANAAKNTGIDQVPAHVPYFMLLDSDDLFLPGAVSTLVAVLDADVDRAYSMAIGWARAIPGGGDKGRVAHLPGRTGLVTYEDALLGRYTGDFQFLCRRSIVGDMRFEERARGTTATMWWRALRAAPGWLVPDVVKEMDTSGDDHMSVPTFNRRGATGMMWGRRVYLEQFGDDLRRLSPASYAGMQLELAKWSALAGDGSAARRAARIGLRTHPSPRAVATLVLAFIPSGAALKLGGWWARMRRRLSAS